MIINVYDRRKITEERGARDSQTCLRLLKQRTVSFDLLRSCKREAVIKDDASPLRYDDLQEVVPLGFSRMPLSTTFELHRFTDRKDERT